MSWGNMFDDSGSFTGETFDYGGGSSYDSQSGFGGGNKRSSYQHDGDQVFKKPRGGGRGGARSGGGSSGGGWGSGGGSDFGGGQSSGGSDWNDEGPMSWDNMGSFGDSDDYDSGAADDGFSGLSEITSWDQISSGGGGGGNKRGGGRGSGGRQGQGRFSGQSSGGYSGNSSYGNQSSYSNQSWSEGNFSEAPKRYKEKPMDENSGYGGRNNYGGGGGGGGRGFGGNRGGGRDGGGRGRGGGGFGNKGRGGYQGGKSFGGGGYGNTANLSLIEKFERFIEYLKGDRVQRQNSIQSIENACMSLNMNLKTNYYVEELPRIFNRQIFTSKISVNGIFLGRGVGCNKKELKHEVFNKAHDLLLKASLEDINNLKDYGVDMVRASIEKYLKCSAPGTYAEGHGVPVAMPMSDIMNEITKNLDTIFILCTGIKKLKTYLNGSTQLPENPISMLEQAMIASKCGLRHIYQSESTNEGDTIMYEGSFILEDTAIARSTNVSKKICKQETYSSALDALLNKNVNDLVIPVQKEKTEADDEEEHVRNEAIVTGVTQPDGDAPPPIAKPSLRDAPAIEKVASLISTLQTTAFSENNITVVDNCACNSGLSAMCIYKRIHVTSEECASCEYFIDNIHVSTGLGNNRTECMMDAYNNAWETLTSTLPEDLLANHRRLTPNETTDPFVLEVVVKGGTGLNKESNRLALRRRGWDPDDDTKTLKDLVIVETSSLHKDRKLNAFSILQHSATCSGLLLQWTFQTLKPFVGKSYRNEPKPMSKVQCALYLKGNKMGEHTAFGKSKTRNFAAAEILHRLYETQDVVRVCTEDFSSKCVQYFTIQTEADALRVKAGQPKPQPIVDIMTERKADRFIVNAVSNRMDSFFPSAEDFIIGPGVPEVEVREIRALALSKHYNFYIRQQQGLSYLIIQNRIDMKNIVKKLKDAGGIGMYGKYKLVPKSECPKHSDLNIK